MLRTTAAEVVIHPAPGGAVTRFEIVRLFTRLLNTARQMAAD